MMPGTGPCGDNQGGGNSEKRTNQRQGKHLIDKVHGKIAGLKASQIKRLQKLY